MNKKKQGCYSKSDRKNYNSEYYKQNSEELKKKRREKYKAVSQSPDSALKTENMPVIPFTTKNLYTK